MRCFSPSMCAFVSVGEASRNISSRYLDRCFRWMPAANAIAFCVSACGKTYRSSMFRKSEKYRRMRSSVVRASGESSFTAPEPPATRIILPSLRFADPVVRFLQPAPSGTSGEALPPGTACTLPVRGDLRCGHEGRDCERPVHPVPGREAPLREDPLPHSRPMGLQDEDRTEDCPAGLGRIVPPGGL